MRTPIIVLLMSLALATSSFAGTFTRVAAVPATNVFSLTANGDTIVAGTDTCVFVSTDAGANWHASARVTATTPVVFAARMHHGTLYAGTANQGVFVSTDLGATWSAFNQGLVGGILNSQLAIADFAIRGDDLLVGTLGAGVYVRPLVPGGTWHPFGDAFEPNQASDVRSIALDGTRLVAAAGGNGMVFDRDPADPDWTVSFLHNGDLAPGLQATSVIWNGNGWVVGSNVGVFRSATGQEPWTLVDPGLGTIHGCPLATVSHQLFAAFDATNHAVMASSSDNGATWVPFDDFPFRFVFALAVSGGDLYAARVDGLYRMTGAVSVSDPPIATSRFGLVGPQPAGDLVRFRIESPKAGPAAIEIFDVAGRRAAPPIRFEQPVGALELPWDASGLGTGVYLARLTTQTQQGSVRVVHIR